MTSTPAPPSSGAMTSEERWSQIRRTIAEGRSRMAGGTLYTLMAGAGAVAVLGGFEGWLCIKPSKNLGASAVRLTTFQRLWFVGRYSLTQIIPSVIQESQPTGVIAQVLGLPRENFYSSPCSAPPQRHLMINRLRAIRGALAGSVILSQVLAIMDVLGQTRTAYVNRIRLGREPPLEDFTRQGVVIRLQGQASLLCNLTMAREGRRHFFPIVENPKHPDIVSLVNDHALALSSEEQSHLTSKKPPPRVPVFWHCRDGGYSHKSSWRGMSVPFSWLFTTTTTTQPTPSDDNNDNTQPPRRLLILEADATPGDNTAMSLRQVGVDDFDLDLYEVAQGFTQVQSLVINNKNTGDDAFDTIRILLVDTDAKYQSGGGRQMTVREHATELGLADVIVDARDPLVFSMKGWLEQFYNQQQQQPSTSSSWTQLLLGTRSTTQQRRGRKPVILETPRRDWFLSIQAELVEHGNYQVMDRADALKEYGSLEGIPFLVYERNTADTLNTVRQLIASQMTTPTHLCALCPRPFFLESIMESRVEGVTYISSSDIHDRLLRWVRQEALQGKTAATIQHALDTRLPEILHQAMTVAKYANGIYATLDATTTLTASTETAET
ncbi:expressed unknown protein [Seminavis robusta]|uniref:Uncharacterized protein n=1 Tax=Seminavis robusta TaxID=568900 RepID=A0A9N8EPA9_9STRA|nr:expressed unknown protein [Seminavis robusta]|eukprot:Sro1364_g266450.1 n/a (608) ;mRNA; r:12106-14031